MKKFLLAGIANLFAQAALAETDIELSDGLTAAEQRLQSISTPTASDHFALGGIRFLKTIETTLQMRYRSNATFESLGLPVLRLSVPENLEAEPMLADLVMRVFKTVDEGMIAARDHLEQAASSDAAVVLDLSELWFDINANGVLDRGENSIEAILATIQSPFAPPPENLPADMSVRFDDADLRWLLAYTHMLQGVSQTVLAFDPTDITEEVMAANSAMKAMNTTGLPDPSFISANDAEIATLIAIIYGAINQRPDPDHLQSARVHFLQMISENEMFWSLVAQETDNDREWIPNAAQTAALGFELPPETGERWLAVLSDARDVLNGDLLVPHWRIAPSAGVNIASLIENPPVFDLVSFLHGYGLVPYMESGEIVGTGNLRQFERLMGGNSVLFMFLLN